MWQGVGVTEGGVEILSENMWTDGVDDRRHYLVLIRSLVGGVMWQGVGITGGGEIVLDNMWVRG